MCLYSEHSYYSVKNGALPAGVIISVIRKLSVLFVFILIAAYIAISIYVAEGVLHPGEKRLSDRDKTRGENLAQRNAAVLVPAEIRNKDAILRGWFFKKTNSTRVVVLFHGQSDNRAGMLGYADLFLRNGYSVLSPDSRAHGMSGGEYATYGLKEVRDVSDWIDWLSETQNSNEIFGMGESMGAAILLQSVATENRWKAIVAESAFCDFRQIARERLQGHLKGLAVPLLESSLWYSRLRYGLEMNEASPKNAVIGTEIPILLIHGVQDASIGPHHSKTISQCNRRIQLWLIANTGHSAALGTHPLEFERRVLEFFDR